MSPALLLLRLLAVLLIPLLVAPTIVSVGPDEPAPAVRTAALALSVADQAADVADPLAPPPSLVQPVRPARAADAVTALAPAATVRPEPGDTPAEESAAAPGKDAAQGKDVPDAEAPAEKKAEPKGKAEVEPKGKAEPKGEAPAKADPAAKGQAAPETKAPAKKKAAAAEKKAEPAKKAKDAPEQAGKGRAAAAAPAAPAAPPRSLYLGVGHGRAPDGRWQPGAEHPGHGAFEVDAAQIMVDAMVEVLRDAPNLELHAESGDHPNMIGSVARANALGVDDCIEVHQDTAAAPPGAFGHWYAGATAANRLADRLVGAVADQGVPIRHDWHRARSGLYWVRKSECRAVLMEVGRVGDYSVEQLQVLGRAMAKAYLRDTKEARGIG